MNREEILQTAMVTVCKDRQDAYGNPEDNFGLIARLWTEYIDNEDVVITKQDVAVMMILVKVARIRTGCAKDDNWVDICGYSACGGETNGKN